MYGGFTEAMSDKTSKQITKESMIDIEEYLETQAGEIRSVCEAFPDTLMGLLAAYALGGLSLRKLEGKLDPFTYRSIN